MIETILLPNTVNFRLDKYSIFMNYIFATAVVLKTIFLWITNLAILRVDLDSELKFSTIKQLF